MENEQLRQIEIIYKQYYKLLVAYAYRYLTDWSAANDAVQETFHDVCQSPERLLSSEQPLAWLKVACRYVCMGMLRRRKINRQTILSLEEIDERDLPPVYDPELQEEIGSLTGVDDPEEIELLRRILILQEPYESVAKSLGISVWACYKRVERLRDKIKKNYEKSF